MVILLKSTPRVERNHLTNILVDRSNHTRFSRLGTLGLPPFREERALFVLSTDFTLVLGCNVGEGE